MSRILPAAVLAATLALPGAAHAAVDYFLKIDGVPGESRDERHKGEIEVSSWSWGAAQVASNANRTKPCVASINFTKLLDKASPVLMANAVSGMLIPNAILIGRRAGGDPGAEQLFIKIELKTVIVSSYQSGGTPSNTPMDSFALNFASATFEYHEQSSSGGSGPATRATFAGGC